MSNLFQLVARHAERSGGEIAISKWSPGARFVETSYAELLRKVRRFAARLEEFISQRTMVPMLVGKSADSVALMLAAIKTGRPFCFVNTKYRGPQIAAVLDASAAQVCVIDAPGILALKGAWKDHPQVARVTWVVIGKAGLTGIYAAAADALRNAAKVILFEEDDRNDSQEMVTRDTVRPNTPGTCLFTSGSTGEPKGVLISEDDLMRRAETEIAWFGLKHDDVLLSILPFSFDVGLNQLMTALAVGAELVVLDSWLPADILAATEQRRVTGISGVPSIWQDMISAGVQFDTHGRHASLRYITISGGSLPRQYLERLPEIASGVQIFKTYGQTEAFRSTSLRPEEYHRKLDSVGKAFPGVRVYVVREDGSPCAPGEVGEVVHTGLGIMIGYMARTDGHAEIESKIRNNTFFGAHDSSPVAVFTGDLGYLDDDGYLFLKGRRDNLVKVMGNRVYPEEVANQIVKICGVRDAAVVGVTSEDGRSVLLAFVAPLQRVELSAGAVRRALNTKLPAFMIPKEIVIVKQIPRGPTGKADGRRLVEEYNAAAGSRAGTKEAQIAS